MQAYLTSNNLHSSSSLTSLSASPINPRKTFRHGYFNTAAAASSSTSLFPANVAQASMRRPRGLRALTPLGLAGEHVNNDTFASLPPEAGSMASLYRHSASITSSNGPSEDDGSMHFYSAASSFVTNSTPSLNYPGHYLHPRHRMASSRRKSLSSVTFDSKHSSVYFTPQQRPIDSGDGEDNNSDIDQISLHDTGATADSGGRPAITPPAGGPSTTPASLPPLPPQPLSQAPRIADPTDTALESLSSSASIGSDTSDCQHHHSPRQYCFSSDRSNYEGYTRSSSSVSIAGVGDTSRHSRSDTPSLLSSDSLPNAPDLLLLEVYDVHSALDDDNNDDSNEPGSHHQCHCQCSSVPRRSPSMPSSSTTPAVCNGNSHCYHHHRHYHCCPTPPLPSLGIAAQLSPTISGLPYASQQRQSFIPHTPMPTPIPDHNCGRHDSPSPLLSRRSSLGPQSRHPNDATTAAGRLPCSGRVPWDGCHCCHQSPYPASLRTSATAPALQHWSSTRSSTSSASPPLLPISVFGSGYDPRATMTTTTAAAAALSDAPSHDHYFGSDVVTANVKINHDSGSSSMHSSTAATSASSGHGLPVRSSKNGDVTTATVDNHCHPPKGQVGGFYWDSGEHLDHCQVTPDGRQNQVKPTSPLSSPTCKGSSPTSNTTTTIYIACSGEDEVRARDTANLVDTILPAVVIGRGGGNGNGDDTDIYASFYSSFAPTSITCPKCCRSSKILIERRVGRKWAMVSLVLLVVFIPAFWIPLVSKRCKKWVYVCTHCHRSIRKAPQATVALNGWGYGGGEVDTKRGESGRECSDDLIGDDGDEGKLAVPSSPPPPPPPPPSSPLPQPPQSRWNTACRSGKRAKDWFKKRRWLPFVL